jgi:hypothetical protein
MNHIINRKNMKNLLLTCGILATVIQMVMAQPKLTKPKQWFNDNFLTLEVLMSQTPPVKGTAMFPGLHNLMNVQIANTNIYISSLKITYTADSAKATANNNAATREKAKALANQQHTSSLLRSVPNNQQYKISDQKAQASVNKANADANNAAAELQALQKEGASITYYLGIVQTQRASVSNAETVIQALNAPHPSDVIDQVNNLRSALSAFVATLQ